MKAKIFKAVTVLSVITIICVSLLALVNNFWRLSEEERFSRAVKSVMPADEFKIVYNYDDPSEQQKNSENYKQILDFNKEYGATNLEVNKVRVAVGGEYDGCYLIESTGRGYKSAYVKMIIGYDKDGKIIGTKPMDVDKINDFAYNINWNTLSQKLKGKSGNVGTGTDLSVLTGATPVNTLNGAAEAINIANTFYLRVLMGEKESSQIITDQAMLSSLNSLFEVDDSSCKGTNVSQFRYYPIRTAETELNVLNLTGAKAKLSGVYYVDSKYVILEVDSVFNRYGGWTLLVLLGNNDTVAAVAPIDHKYVIHGSFDAVSLDSAKTMTKLYAGKSIGDISKDDSLNAVTSATQSSKGLRVTVFYALEIKEWAVNNLNTFVSMEGLKNG